MAESSAVAANQQILATQYNDLRDDVLDPTDGHAHLGGAEQGKTLDVAAIASGRFGVARLPAVTDEYYLVGTGGNMEERAIPIGATIVRKTADETVNNNEALQNDDELVLPVGANEIWYFVMVVRAHTLTVDPDLDHLFTIPAAGSLERMKYNEPAMGSTVDATVEVTLQLFADTDMYGARHYLYVGGVNSGSIQYQWAQHTATAEDTKVLANSFILAFRLA